MRGSWLPLGTSAPLPYPLHTLNDTWDYANRVERCAQYSPSAHQYAWTSSKERMHASATTPMDGGELCHRMHLTNALIIGDSLGLQLFESWAARLRHAHASHSRGGHCSIASPASSPASTCEGWAGELCAGLCAGGANHGQANRLSSCDNGATLLMVQAYRWILDSRDFEASDERGAHCAADVRRSPHAWGLTVVPSAHVEHMLWTAARRQQTSSNLTAAIAQPSVAVLFNQFYHLHQFIMGVASCYSLAGISDSGADTSGGKLPRGAAYATAVRDVLSFWSRDAARWATLLEALAVKLRPTVEVHSYYLTSHQSCDAFCVPPGGAPRRPINASAIFDASLMRGAAEYSHQWAHWANDLSKTAFAARGHGIIDLEAMLSVRVDAHPASFDGQGDRVHFCAPGPLDWALDVVVRHVAQRQRPGAEDEASPATPRSAQAALAGGGGRSRRR